MWGSTPPGCRGGLKGQLVQFYGVDIGEIARPFVAVYVGLYADVLDEFAVVTELNDLMNAAVERLTAGGINTGVLEVRGNISDDEDLGIAFQVSVMELVERPTTTFSLAEFSGEGEDSEVDLFASCPQPAKPHKISAKTGIIASVLFIFFLLSVRFEF